jgi:hypothetical protein
MSPSGSSGQLWDERSEVPSAARANSQAVVRADDRPKPIPFHPVEPTRACGSRPDRATIAAGMEGRMPH